MPTPSSAPAEIITVVWLGDGRRGALTVEALDALRRSSRLYVMTGRQLILDELRDDLPPYSTLQFLDGLCDATGPQAVVDYLLAAAAQGPLTFALPGQPLWGDPIAALLSREASERGISLRAVGGSLSLETLLHSPEGASGLQVVDARALPGVSPGSAAEGLAERWTGLSPRLLNAQLPLLIGPITSAATVDRALRWLGERYSSGHGVTLLSLSGVPAPVSLQPVAQGAATPELALAGSATFALYVPPLAPLDDLCSPDTLGYITARLRGPGGCPWDREQTHRSLTPYMIEEAYEAVDAVERGDDADLVEELGDVMLQVVLHSQLAEEEGHFSLADVAAEVNRKLVRRHPHVFGDVQVSGSSEVLRNWEQIKRVEKGERRNSALDGIPPALPALSLAQTMGRKAAKLGFDWPDVDGVLAKVREEIAELQSTDDPAERHNEIGDLLFALSSLCRHLGIDGEDALRSAARKFERRFRRVEALAQEQGVNLTTLDPESLDRLWEQAKSAKERLDIDR
jgi:tetrapyrrole methylase family protein/MazG family protein